ncbi:response regulator transcription factor [Streptomyces sp. NPDC059900]|uniref:response regulator transcription factor n=1 Tax=Streptomyces sp. NPDC059900 TaxID=3155816 RepID=UPI003D02BB3D
MLTLSGLEAAAPASAVEAASAIEEIADQLAGQHEELLRRQRRLAETHAEALRLLRSGAAGPSDQALQAELPTGDDTLSNTDLSSTELSSTDLSSTERALLRLAAEGCTDAAAASRLHVSHRTARRMMAALMERLGARSRFEAGVKAARLGWL